jgi:hypothetical protein
MSEPGETAPYPLRSLQALKGVCSAVEIKSAKGRRQIGAVPTIRYSQRTGNLRKVNGYGVQTMWTPTAKNDKVPNEWTPRPR